MLTTHFMAFFAGGVVTDSLAPVTLGYESLIRPHRLRMVA